MRVFGGRTRLRLTAAGVRYLRSRSGVTLPTTDGFDWLDVRVIGR